MNDLNRFERFLAVGDKKDSMNCYKDIKGLLTQEPTVTVREARESKSIKNQARKSFKNGCH